MDRTARTVVSDWEELARLGTIPGIRFQVSASCDSNFRDYGMGQWGPVVCDDVDDVYDAIELSPLGYQIDVHALIPVAAVTDAFDAHLATIAAD